MPASTRVIAYGTASSSGDNFSIRGHLNDLEVSKLTIKAILIM